MNESRRPSHPRRELDCDVLATVPAVPFELDVDKFQHNLMTGRRGAAGGPSGMSGEHLKIVLESRACTALLSESASQLARAEMLEEIVKSIWEGRVTILQKPDGGVRGIVVGDVFFFVVWSQGPSPNSTPRCGRPQPTRSNMPCPRERAQNVSHTLSRH